MKDRWSATNLHSSQQNQHFVSTAGIPWQPQPPKLCVSSLKTFFREVNIHLPVTVSLYPAPRLVNTSSDCPLGSLGPCPLRALLGKLQPVSIWRNQESIPSNFLKCKCSQRRCNCFLHSFKDSVGAFQQSGWWEVNAEGIQSGWIYIFHSLYVSAPSFCL